MASDTPLVPRSVSVPIAMFAFFLFFSTIGGLWELFAEGPEGEQQYALFAASASTIVFGLAMSWIGPRLPAKWWGEAILVAVIFYVIWLIMFAISTGIDGEAIWSGLIYAVLGGLLGGVFFQLSSRSQR